MNKDTLLTEEIPTVHWADHTAQELIEKHPSKMKFTCASGISPSGMVHIGNFREVITVDLVVRSLKERGKSVRFIYSWDDYDAYRKVPVNVPNQELLKENLRKPLALVPDPFERKASYATHFEAEFEQSLQAVEVNPEFIRQNEPYRAAVYKEGILTALQNESTIRKILNAYRTEPLPESWTVLSIFCRDCKKDVTELKGWKETGEINYHCKICKKETTTNFNEPESGVKLLWRVDWPMRWAKEGVDFEPGGKDHSSEGGSFDTGCQIVREVWKKEPPAYVQYDFVIAKGLGAKFSSSSGNLITLEEALLVYEPSVVRWIFASRKPNTDFSIAFDLDVLKAYDDFDRTTRIALKLEAAEEKKYFYEKRIYELSITSEYPKSGDLVQYPFRHLCNLVQIYQGDLEKTLQSYGLTNLSENDRKRFLRRATCAWNWINTHAPQEFQFKLRTAQDPAPTTQFPAAICELIELFEKTDFMAHTEESFHAEIFQLMKRNGIPPKAMFQDLYQILIQKNQGPKVASFFLILGKEKSLELLKRVPSLQK